MSLKDRINKMKQQNGNGALFHDISPFCRKVLITTAIASSFLLGENKAFSQEKDAVEKEKIENVMQNERGYENRTLSFAERKASLDRAVENGELLLEKGNKSVNYRSSDTHLLVAKSVTDEAGCEFSIRSLQKGFEYPMYVGSEIKEIAADFKGGATVEDTYYSDKADDLNSYWLQETSVWGKGRTLADKKALNIRVAYNREGPISTFVREHKFNQNTDSEILCVFPGAPSYDKFYPKTEVLCHNRRILRARSYDKGILRRNVRVLHTHNIDSFELLEYGVVEYNDSRKVKSRETKEIAGEESYLFKISNLSEKSDIYFSAFNDWEFCYETDYFKTDRSKALTNMIIDKNKAFSQEKDAVEKEKIENMAQPETGYKNRNLSFAERKASLDRAVEKGDVYMLGGHAEGEYVSYNVEGYGRVAVGNFDKEKGYYYFVLLSDQIEDFTYPALTDKGVENMTDFESHNRVEDIYISKTPADVNSFKHKNVTVWGTGRDPVDNSQTQRWVSIENDDDGNFPIATTVFEGFGKETVARTTYVFDNHPEHDKYYACTYESCYDGQRLSVQNRDDAGHLMRSCQYKKGDATLEVINYSTSGKVNKKENVPFYCPTFNYYFPLKYEWQRNDVLDEVKQDWNENEKRKEQSQLAAKDVKQLKDNLTR